MLRIYISMNVYIFAASAMILSQTVTSASANETWRGQSVAEFKADENEAFDWVIINDGVMGGLSEGDHEMTEAGTLKFWGDLSTKNNGGFSMVTSQKVDFDFSNDLGLLINAKGDGRTYTARLVTDARFRGMEVSFSANFETTVGEFTQVQIPFTDFKGSFRGRDLPNEKFNPASIERIAILIGDKKDAPFEIEVDWIRTYGKGKATLLRPKVPTPQNVSAGTGPQSLIATAVSDGRFTTWKAALDAAELTTFFQWDNPLTVFAPTDEAFAKLPEGMVKELLRPENKDKLVAILSYHVVTGATDLSDAIKAKSAKTIQGESVAVKFAEGEVLVNDAAMINSDIKCTDGLIHVIDTVLLPSSMKPTSSE